MRVISGEYRGRILRTVNDLSVRPATGRVKQTLFDMLAARMELQGTVVLDIFAGSGNLGIEALSRGAALAVFVENNPRALDAIELNVRSLGCEARTEIYQADALAYIEQEKRQYDIVFADPPYAYDTISSLPHLLFSHAIVKPGGYLLVEHANELHFEDTDRYRTGPVKKFGRTLVTFFRNISA